MLSFEWNSLRKGDRVLVHDPGSADLALVAGVVAWVDRRKGANGSESASPPAVGKQWLCGPRP